jgi:NADH dehydrogenase
VSSRTRARSRVVILGGGFAGLAAALHLRADHHRVTLVDRRACFEFLPNVHELLSGVKTPDLLRLPLGACLRHSGHRFVRDTVVGIDPASRTVRTRRRSSPLDYDSLIVALGGVDSTHGVEGVVEHALPFKSVDECARIGQRLARLARRRRPGRVVIVGGGLEGVEALGEILRRHRASRRLRLTLVEARERLLPEAPAALDPYLRELCAPHGVAFEVNVRVRRVEAARVVLSDGRSLPADLVIWTGGPAPPPLLAASGLAPAGAWAPVDGTLQSKGHPEVFVAGDAAELPTTLPKQGYHALDMGVCAARNVERFLAGRDLVRFRPAEKPMLATFGDLTTLLVTGERVLAGPPLAAAKEAVFEAVMALLDPGPWSRRLPRIAARTGRAARALLWPAVSSLGALRRQGRLSLLR